MPYEFKTKPYQHQEDVFRDSWDARHYALFMEMGTGKSKIAVDSIAALYEADKINTALIVAPKGVYHNWTNKELPAHMPERINHQVLPWQPNITQKFKQAFVDLCKSKSLKIFVMNIEAFSTSKGAETALWFAKQYGRRGIMVVDESTTIKNRKANRTKAVIAAGEHFAYKRLLTGSPVTKSPMDLYSQCEFLDSRLLGFTSYYSFQGRY
ncbi:MAG: SNF2-related protein, partial [Pseudomonadota bacterium]|nr:SNF2-related protein [Pseudomonadota bacterium]